MIQIYQYLQSLNTPFSISKAGEEHMRTGLTAGRDDAIRRKMKKGFVHLLPLTGLGLAGCVQVTAPDKPIVINLNIAIRQDVLIKLDAPSKKLVDENEEIF
jgi:YnbE-like lipoprotein